MADIFIGEEGHVGRITLNRPHALNALTFDMCRQIEAAIDQWQDNRNINLVLIDAAGDRAFCAGGDLAQMYWSGLKQDYRYGHDFWRMEYRLNAKIHSFSKPIVSFLHGFTMGGGVGIGCHGQHRIVNETSRVAMPECTVGLVPDVGGSYILAQNEGFLGEFLGTTGVRLNPGDAIRCGFADRFVAAEKWEKLKSQLVATGNPSLISQYQSHPPPSDLDPDTVAAINAIFGSSLPEIMAGLEGHATPWSQKLLARLAANSPLSMACTLQLIKDQRTVSSIETALDQEFRFTYRAAEHGDFLEGIRARVIDKDYEPAWRHHSVAEVSDEDVAFMLAPLGHEALIWE